MTECSVDGCETRVYARGWCVKHWQRWRRHGDPVGRSPRPRYEESEESFAARVAWDGDHLIWIGSECLGGYGRMFEDGRRVQAHRYAWERVNGTIPDDMVVDHVCHNRACVLPEHLRLATQLQNSQNRRGPNRNSSTGVRGVSRYRDGKRFVAQVSLGGSRRHLGLFNTIEDATIAVKNARETHYGEYAGN